MYTTESSKMKFFKRHSIDEYYDEEFPGFSKLAKDTDNKKAENNILMRLCRKNKKA